MELRPLGNTALRVSVLGLGTVKLGRTAGLKYRGSQSRQPLPTDEQAADLFRAAADLGINLIDTAPAYGTSEQRIGELMSRHAWLGRKREDWIICTKAGEEFDDATATSRYDFSPAAIRASVHRSLERLRIDTLDIVLLHSDDRDEFVLKQSGALDALRDLQRAGLIRAIGASTKAIEGGHLALAERCDVVMLALNPSDTSQRPVITAAARAGVGVLIKKALASGHAADIPGALAFAAATRGVSSIVVGTANPANLRANAAAIPP